MRYALAGAIACIGACSQPQAPQAPAIAVRDARANDAATETVLVDAAPPQLDRDGDDDPEAIGSGAAPQHARFEKVGTPPLALARVCDLTPLGDALYMAHANSPLGSDGATITRYAPDAARPFAVAFDWNRRGEPTRGGGAGQGFLRVHAIDGRLYVADADPPYNGLKLVERGTEGYVFVSARDGTFAPPRAPGKKPPTAPDLTKPDGKAGAGVLPRAYHVLDVIRFRGNLYASTGSVPPDERAWRGPSPGALHRASTDGARWLYEVDYPFPYESGVWRLTYLVRFRDRLYAGIQDYDGREPNDFLMFMPEARPGRLTLERKHIKPVRVTATGAAGTLRWWVDTHATPPRLYWLAWDSGDVVVRATTDGDTWTTLALPAGAGRAADIARFRDTVVLLTERGLWRVTGDVVDKTPIARIDDKQSPFAVTDLFCAAPLAVFRNELYAGGQRGGSLWKLVVDASPNHVTAPASPSVNSPASPNSGDR
ncbi:MAG TPA: hypothetical protein VIV11_11260 [Kofleriaceae bacterium]